MPHPCLSNNPILMARIPRSTGLASLEPIMKRQRCPACGTRTKVSKNQPTRCRGCHATLEYLIDPSDSNSANKFAGAVVGAIVTAGVLVNLGEHFGITPEPGSVWETLLGIVTFIVSIAGGAIGYIIGSSKSPDPKLTARW